MKKTVMFASLIFLVQPHFVNAVGLADIAGSGEKVHLKDPEQQQNLQKYMNESAYVPFQLSHEIKIAPDRFFRSPDVISAVQQIYSDPIVNSRVLLLEKKVNDLEQLIITQSDLLIELSKEIKKGQ